MSGITDDLKHNGYDQEEAYFQAENRRKIKALREKEGCKCNSGCKDGCAGKDCKSCGDKQSASGASDKG